MPLQVRTFHAELAPLWDAPAGDRRASDTCDSLAVLKSRASSLHGVHAEQVRDVAAYTAAVEALEADLAAMDEPCATLDRAVFEERFTSVHGEFESVTAALR